MKPQYSSARVQIALVAMLALLVLAYWAALPGPFLLDDFKNLPQAQVETWSLSALIDASLSNSSGPLGRPVSALTFALNYLITGDNTVGFKIVNLAIHAANALLVFLLLRKLAAEVWKRHPVAELKPCHLAFAVAFLWALHPSHVSTVMYVVQRMSVLSTFFMLASMNCYASARLHTLAGGKSFWGLAAAVILFGLLGIFSKESGILLIAYLALIEWTIFRQSVHSIKLSGQRLIAVLAIGTSVTLMLAYPLVSLIHGTMGGYELREFSLKERLLTQPAVVFDYFGQILFPRIDQMGLYFDAFPLIKQPDAMFIWPLLFLICLVIAFFRFLKKMPLLSLSIGMFLASQLIESTFLPLELKFEHRNYFGSIGIIAGLVFVLGTCRLSLHRPDIARFVFGALVIVLVSQTSMRSNIWRDDLKLNSHEVERAPLSKRARSALAISLSQAGRTDDALEQVRKTISQYPDDTYAPLQLFQICALASSDCSKELKVAQQSAGSGTITMDTVSILGDLIANNRRELINGLGIEELVGLLSSAAENPNRQLHNTSEAKLQILLSEGLLETRRLIKLTEAIQRAVTLDPTNSVILTRAAEIMAGVGSLDDAESILAHLEAVAPVAVLRSDRVSAVRTHLAKRRERETARSELLEN